MPPAPSHVTTGNSGTELSAVSGPQAHRINPSTFWAGGAQPNNPSASYAPTLTQAHNAAGGGDASLPSLDRCVLTSCAWVGPCPGLLCASLLARPAMFLRACADGLRLRATEEERQLWEPLTPWCMFSSKVKGFARRIHPEALSALAELFLVNGDMSAWLYTGSQLRMYSCSCATESAQLRDVCLAVRQIPGWCTAACCCSGGASALCGRSAVLMPSLGSSQRHSTSSTQHPAF
eukprot:1133533-Pelagomonas_calceolata.AAC.3